MVAGREALGEGAVDVLAREAHLHPHTRSRVVGHRGRDRVVEGTVEVRERQVDEDPGDRVDPASGASAVLRAFRAARGPGAREPRDQPASSRRVRRGRVGRELTAPCYQSPPPGRGAVSSVLDLPGLRRRHGGRRVAGLRTGRLARTASCPCPCWSACTCPVAPADGLAVAQPLVGEGHAGRRPARGLGLELLAHDALPLTRHRAGGDAPGSQV